MHRSQMTSAERARVRIARRDAGGTVGKDGVVSFFYQGAGNAPTEAEQRAGARFDSGAELEGPETYRCGPDLGKIFDE